MNLCRVELNHVGPFSGPVVLEGLEPVGLHVLAAENETGKSLLIRAVVRGLFDKCTSSDSAIKALQPVGTSLGPRVTVEFEVGGGRYRIEKQFIKNTHSQLSSWRESGWHLLAEEDEAEKQILQLLHTNAPGRGASKDAHWGMLSHLWAQQGVPTQWLNVKEEVGEKLRKQFTTVELDPVLDCMTDALETVAGGSLTPLGKLKKGGPAETAEAQEIKVADQLATLELKLEGLASDISRFEDLGPKVKRIEDELQSHQEKHGRLKSKFDLAADGLKLVRQLKGELEAQQNTLNSVITDFEKLEGASKSLSEADGKRQDFTQKLENKKQEASQLEENLQSAKNTQQQAQERWAGANTEHQRTIDLIDLRRKQDDAAQLKKAVKKTQGKDQALKDKREELDALPPIDTKAMGQLDRLQREIDKLKAQIEVSGLSVTLEPEAGGTIETHGGEPEGFFSVQAGESYPLNSPNQLEIILPEWGRISVRSGAGEARDLSSQLKSSHSDLEEQLASSGCNNLEEARKILGQRNSLEQQVKDERFALEEQLDEFESLDDLRAEVKRLEEQAKTQAIKLKPTSEELATDLNPLRNQKESQRQDLQQAEIEKKQSDQVVLNVEEKLKIPQADCGKLEDQLKQVQIDQATFTADKEGVEKRYSDGLDSAKVDAARKVAVTQAKLELEQTKLPDDVDNLESKLSRADSAVKDTAWELAGERQELNRLDGSIRGQGGTGLYSEKAALAESLARYAATAERELTQARAARLVSALLNHHKRESIAGITGPLEEELQRGFSAITGRADRRVFLDENLGIRGIGRDEDQLLAFEHLSQGAKEQLLLCLRGAVAMKLADTEPHVLILDDALVNTDGVRQDRVLQYLETLAARLQVIVLTCHGDRYRGVGTKIEFSEPDAS